MGKLTTLRPKVATIDTRRGSGAAVERIRGWKLHKIRRRIAIKYDYACVDCGCDTVDGEVDHETPLSMGGAESDENRRWRCKDCHRLKSEREERERESRS